MKEKLKILKIASEYDKNISEEQKELIDDMLDILDDYEEVGEKEDELAYDLQITREEQMVLTLVLKMVFSNPVMKANLLCCFTNAVFSIARKLNCVGDKIMDDTFGELETLQGKCNASKMES